MPTYEELRSPLYTFEAGSEFAEMVGVAENPEEHPLSYAEALNDHDPRTVRREALRMGLETGPQVYDDPEQVACIEATSQKLGLLEAEYPIGPALQGSRRRMVTVGAARNAIFDRIMYGAEKVHDGEIVIDQLDVLGAISRKLMDDERTAIDSWASKHVPSWNDIEGPRESDLAVGSLARAKAERPELFAADSTPEDERIRAQAFGLLANGPDTYEALTEYVWRTGYGAVVLAGGLIAVTQAIYTPFMTHEGEAVSLRLGGTPIDFIGCPSPANVAAKRTPDVMATEIVRTLAAAARHHNTRRRLGLPRR